MKLTGKHVETIFSFEYFGTSGFCGTKRDTEWVVGTEETLGKATEAECCNGCEVTTAAVLCKAAADGKPAEAQPGT